MFHLLSTIGALAVGVVSAATPDLASMLGDACFLNISRAGIPPRLFGRPFSLITVAVADAGLAKNFEQSFFVRN